MALTRREDRALLKSNLNARRGSGTGPPLNQRPEIPGEVQVKRKMKTYVTNSYVLGILWAIGCYVDRSENPNHDYFFLRYKKRFFFEIVREHLGVKSNIITSRKTAGNSISSKSAILTSKP